MTSSKFPLYLTNEEWRTVINLLIGRANVDTIEWTNDKHTYGSIGIETLELVRKLKDQLEKLGMKA